MKTKCLLILGFLSALQLHAKDAPQVDPAPPKDKVQIALLLDTSNSMDGLIDQARTQLQKIRGGEVAFLRVGETPTLLEKFARTGVSARKSFAMVPPMNAAPKISKHAAAVTAACRHIEVSEEIPSLADLAAAAGMSPFHFHRVFKQLTGVTPKEYAVARRAARIRDGLPNSTTVTEAIYQAGFNSNGRFYATSSQTLGMAPRSFRSGGKGEVIRFAVGQCSLGAILVACSEKGVCCITLGDDPQLLLADLQDRFRNAELIGGDENFEKLVAIVVGFVETPQLGLDLPLDVRGTAFQQRVWQALREIPSGSTASYSQIAGKIGSPKSVRAVAGACAANSIAIAIPCHRVVRHDGNLSGYRWGVERKRLLLQREASRSGDA